MSAPAVNRVAILVPVFQIDADRRVKLVVFTLLAAAGLVCLAAWNPGWYRPLGYVAAELPDLAGCGPGMPLSG
jgi:hypothetical protein